MNRTLEDVSHFFLDTRVEESPRCSAQDERCARRLVYVISTAEAVPGSIVTAGFAAIAAHQGRQVLAAEVQGRPFGILFAMGAGAKAGGDRIPVMVTPSGVRVLVSPLSASSLPSFCLYPEDLRVVQDQWRQCELVIVHIEKDYLNRAPSELTPPEDCVIVASETLPDGQSEAYQTIKRFLLWNPEVRIALIASGDSDGGPPLSRLRDAVSRFLERDCSVLGRVTEPTALGAHFLSGGLLGEGWSDVRRVLEPMVSRWMASPASEASAPLGASPWSAGSSPAVSISSPEPFKNLNRLTHRPVGRLRASTAPTPGPWASRGVGLDP
jgi:hypothetical protein